MTKFWPDLPFPKGYANFVGPGRGLLAARSLPLMAGTWLVETVLFRPSKILLWWWAEMVVERQTRISGENPTFS